MKRSMVNLPLNFLPLLVVPVSVSVLASGTAAGVVCADATPVPPSSSRPQVSVAASAARRVLDMGPPQRGIGTPTACPAPMPAENRCDVFPTRRQPGVTHEIARGTTRPAENVRSGL